MGWEGAYSKLEMSGPGRSVPGSRSDAGGRSANHAIRGIKRVRVVSSLRVGESVVIDAARGVKTWDDDACFADADSG